MTVGTKIKEVAARLGLSRSSVTLYCSFCGKSQHDVAKLIAGPSVFICDECVGLCNKYMELPAGTSAKSHALGELDSLPTEKLLHFLKIHETVFQHARSRLHDAVATLRKREVSWATIGDALGVSRQAAWDRFS